MVDGIEQDRQVARQIGKNERELPARVNAGVRIRHTAIIAGQRRISCQQRIYDNARGQAYRQHAPALRGGRKRLFSLAGLLLER